MHTTTQQQAIYRPQPLVDIHRGKDFEGADEKIFSPAYAHQYILLASAQEGPLSYRCRDPGQERVHTANDHVI